MFLKPLGNAFADQAFNGRAHLGRDQLVLGLAGEFGVRHLDRQHAGQAFAGVFAGKGDLFALGQARAFHIIANHPGQGGAEGGQVGASVALGDIVGKAQHGLVIAIIPPQGEVDLDLFTPTANNDWGLDQGCLGLVEVADKGLDPALIMQDLFIGFSAAQVLELDKDAGIQKGQFAQPVFQRLAVKFDRGKGRQGRHEGDAGAG